MRLTRVYASLQKLTDEEMWQQHANEDVMARVQNIPTGVDGSSSDPRSPQQHTN